MFGIGAAIDGVADLIDNTIDKIWPDANEVEKNKIAILKISIQERLDMIKTQTDINLKEAEHKSIWVSGWRPFVGWVCGGGLLYVSLVEPFFRFIAAVVFGYDGVFPVIDTTLTMQVLMGVLGLGIMRSREKEKGVASK